MKVNKVWFSFYCLIPFILPFLLLRIKVGLSTGDFFLTIFTFFLIFLINIFKSNLFKLIVFYICFIELITIILRIDYVIDIFSFLKLLVTSIFIISFYFFAKKLNSHNYLKFTLEGINDKMFSTYLFILSSYYLFLSSIGQYLPHRYFLTTPVNSPFFDSVNAAIYALVISCFAIPKLFSQNNFIKFTTYITIIICCIFPFYIGSRTAPIIIIFLVLIQYLNNLKKLKLIYPISFSRLISFLISFSFIPLVIIPFLILVNNPSKVLDIYSLFSSDIKVVIPLERLIDNSNLIDVIFMDKSFYAREANLKFILEDTPFLQWIFGGGSNSIESIQLLNYNKGNDLSIIEFAHKLGFLGIGLYFIFLAALSKFNIFLFLASFIYSFLQDFISNSNALIIIGILCLCFTSLRIKLSEINFLNDGKI